MPFTSEQLTIMLHASSRSDTRGSTDRMASVQFLRWLAVTLVVLFHSNLQILRLSDGQHLHSFAFGAAGTDMLFVIGGFIMVFITHGKSIGFGEFLVRRVARIAPLYWLLTLLMLGAFLASPGLFRTTAFDLSHFLASLAFLPYPHPVLGSQHPFLAPGWVLNYFLFFYILFALFLFLPTKRRIVVVGLILCALAALWLWFFGASRLLDFYGAPIILDFGLGMLVAWAYLERNAVGPLVIAMALATSAVIFGLGVLREIAGGNDRFLYWGLASAALLFACVFTEKERGWRNPPLC